MKRFLSSLARRPMLFLSTFMVVSMAVLVGTAYALHHWAGLSEDQAGAVVYMALVFGSVLAMPVLFFFRR